LTAPEAFLYSEVDEERLLSREFGVNLGSGRARRPSARLDSF
jgi:hypothetical protein